MEADSGKYYLYRHIRLDKLQPFYIGIGTKNKGCNSFSCLRQEAYKRKRTNPIWTRITNKAEWEVEIIMESDDYEFIKIKEKEFISIYGKIWDKTGILANITDGGEGATGAIRSLETRMKISLKNKGKQGPGKGIPRTQEVKNAISAKNKGSRHPEDVKLKIRAKRKQQDMSHLRRKIFQFSMDGNFIRTFESLLDAVKELNLTSNANLIACCNGKRKSCKGFIWKYHN